MEIQHSVYFNTGLVRNLGHINVLELLALLYKENLGTCWLAINLEGTQHVTRFDFLMRECFHHAPKNESQNLLLLHISVIFLLLYQSPTLDTKEWAQLGSKFCRLVIWSHCRIFPLTMAYELQVVSLEIYYFIFRTIRCSNNKQLFCFYFHT